MAKMENTYKELTTRLWFLVISLIIYRVGAHIPVPGVNLDRIRDMFSGGEGSIFQLFNMFSGGALSNASLLALGVAPYISASIVMQLMSHMYPPLKELRQQGSNGQKKINYYTRYLTLALALLQSFAIARTVMAQGMVLVEGSGFLVSATIGLTAGALFMMWLGEQITERGIGNGISMLIFAGIAVGMPAGIGELIQQAKVGEIGYERFIMLMVVILSLFALIVWVERAQRRIDIHYAKRQAIGGQAMKQRSFLPLKINMAGVIPAIFASAIITLVVSGLALLSDTLPGATGRYISDIASGLGGNQSSWFYVASFSLLIILFSFFYTSMMFENREMADNLKKSNAFIQGFRPGKQTADYLDMVQERLTFVGAIYVAFVCILPSIMQMSSAAGNVIFLFGGTSLLIAVVVAMDFVAQVQSHIMSKKYESLMKRANLSGFGGQHYR